MRIVHERTSASWHSTSLRRKEPGVALLEQAVNVCLDGEDSEWTRAISDDGEILYCLKRSPNIWHCRSAQMNRSHINVGFPPGLLGVEALCEKFYVPCTHAPTNPISGRRFCGGGHHDICYLSIEDTDGNQAGTAVVDGNTVKSLALGKHRFVVLSQTTLYHDEDDPARDGETQSFAGTPGSPAINPQGRSPFGETWFDQSVYHPDICWCLYNVLMVEWEYDGPEDNRVARRIGIGKIHIHAFYAPSAGTFEQDETKLARFRLG